MLDPVTLAPTLVINLWLPSGLWVVMAIAWGALLGVSVDLVRRWIRRRSS